MEYSIKCRHQNGRDGRKKIARAFNFFGFFEPVIGIRSIDGRRWICLENKYAEKKIAADVRVEQAMHTCVICKQNMYFVFSAFRVSMIIMNNTPKLYGSFYLSWLLIFMMRPMKLWLKIQMDSLALMMICRWCIRCTKQPIPLLIRCCGHLFAYDKQTFNRNFLTLLWFGNRKYEMHLFSFLIKILLFSCSLCVFFNIWNEMTSNSRQTNKYEMTIDLPETPDNVNNTNIGRYIAIILNRVAICRRRPIKRKKHKQ